MRFTGLICSMALLAACTESSEPKPVDQTFTSEMASQALSSGLPNSQIFKVHAICGPASGKGLFQDDNFAEFKNDGITEGRLIFFSGADNSGPNVAFRDASGQYQFALSSGADVHLIGEQLSTWVISYADTGVVETHNFVMRDGQLVDLWTSSKPQSLIRASAKIFTSNCFRP